MNSNPYDSPKSKLVFEKIARQPMPRLLARLMTVVWINLVVLVLSAAFHRTLVDNALAFQSSVAIGFEVFSLLFAIGSLPVFVVFALGAALQQRYHLTIIFTANVLVITVAIILAILIDSPTLLYAT